MGSVVPRSTLAPAGISFIGAHYCALISARRTRIPIAEIIFIPLCTHVLLCSLSCHNKGGDVSFGLSLYPDLINTVYCPLNNSLRGVQTAFPTRLCIIIKCIRRTRMRFTIRLLTVCTSDKIRVDLYVLIACSTVKMVCEVSIGNVY